MLLLSLDLSKRMCNRICLIVTELCNNIIKANMITEENQEMKFTHPESQWTPVKFNLDVQLNGIYSHFDPLLP